MKKGGTLPKQSPSFSSPKKSDPSGCASLGCLVAIAIATFLGIAILSPSKSPKTSTPTAPTPSDNGARITSLEKPPYEFATIYTEKTTSHSDDGVRFFVYSPHAEREVLLKIARWYRVKNGNPEFIGVYFWSDKSFIPRTLDEMTLEQDKKQTAQYIYNEHSYSEKEWMLMGQ